VVAALGGSCDNQQRAGCRHDHLSWRLHANRHSRGLAGSPEALTACSRGGSGWSRRWPTGRRLWSASRPIRQTARSWTSDAAEFTDEGLRPTKDPRVWGGPGVLVLTRRRRRPGHAAHGRGTRGLSGISSRTRVAEHRRASRRGPGSVGTGAGRHRPDCRRLTPRQGPRSPAGGGGPARYVDGARTREVMSLMARTAPTKGSPTALFVTEKTVETHVASILGKLDLESQPDDHRRVLASRVPPSGPEQRGARARPGVGHSRLRMALRGQVKERPVRGHVGPGGGCGEIADECASASDPDRRADLERDVAHPQERMAALIVVVRGRPQYWMRKSPDGVGVRQGLIRVDRPLAPVPAAKHRHRKSRRAPSKKGVPPARR